MGRTLAAILFALPLLLGGATLAHAQTPRTFPQDTQFGELTEFNYPHAKIGDKVYTLTPALQIRGTNNLIILPASLRDGGAVRFRLDNMRNVSRIWLLTAAEAELASAEKKNKAAISSSQP